MERGFMSMGPWNTGAPQREDMPRKPIDIKPTDYPVIWKRGLRTLFPLPAAPSTRSYVTPSTPK